MTDEFKIGDEVQFAADPPGVNPPALIHQCLIITIVRPTEQGCQYSVRLDAGHIIPGVEAIQLAPAN